MGEKKVLAALITLVSVLVGTLVALHLPSSEDVKVEAGKEITHEIESQVKDERWQSVFRLAYFALWLVGVALLLSALMLLAKAFFATASEAL